MAKDQYFANSEKDEVELRRLRLLEETYDPNTIRYLERFRLGKGQNCLEIGAGAGSIASWLAMQVGPTGRVVATDINTRFLQRLNVPNIEVRQHNIVQDDLETSEYDLVHCRAVLMHLSEYEKALERMIGSLRPSGWLLVEEADYGSVLSLDLTNPSAVPLISALRIVYDELRKKNTDIYFGRRVRDLVEGHELTDVGNEGWTSIGRGGTSEAQFRWMTTQVVMKPLIASGAITQQQYENAKRLYEDPSFYFLGFTMFSAWGRRRTT